MTSNRMQFKIHSDENLGNRDPHQADSCDPDADSAAVSASENLKIEAAENPELLALKTEEDSLRAELPAYIRSLSGNGYGTRHRGSNPLGTLC